MELIFDILEDLLLVPILWILATPFILILSFFGKKSYYQNLKNYYKKIKDRF